MSLAKWTIVHIIRLSIPVVAAGNVTVTVSDEQNILGEDTLNHVY